MLASLLMIVLIRLSNAVVDLELLFSHDMNTETVDAAENMNLLELFDSIDLDQNALISKSEFPKLVEVMDYNGAFTLIDINENNKLEYDELVYYFKQLIETKPDIIFDGLLDIDEAAIESEYNSLATGVEYNSETEAELLVNAMFFAIDLEHNNYITSTQFTDYMISSDWESVLELIGGNPTEINKDNFKNTFFKCTDYKMLKTMHDADIDELNEFNNYLLSIDAVHSSSDLTLQKQDAELVFEPHEFDSQFADGNRRRLLAIPTVIFGIIKAVSVGTASGSSWIGNPSYGNNHRCGSGCFDFGICHCNCYDQYNMVNVLEKGYIYMKDLSVGDYVYDGNDYTKIYFIQRYGDRTNADMLEISYGNPGDENSITLTAHHLLYYADGKAPVISGDIKVGDPLYGNNDGNNYTVYDIKNVYNKHPINPITASGNLMVNNIKTSVFTKSAAEHKRLTECGKIFAWISDNISQDLAANLVDFYWNVVYVRIIRPNHYIHQLVIDNQTFATMVILFVPALVIMILFRTSKFIKS